MIPSTTSDVSVDLMRVLVPLLLCLACGPTTSMGDAGEPSGAFAGSGVLGGGPAGGNTGGGNTGGGAAGGTGAGGGSTADAGVTGRCAGTGACSSLSSMRCVFALSLGCVPVRTGTCGLRGQCTGAAAQLNETACRNAGRCVWNTAGTCTFDQACTTHRTSEACTNDRCTWTEQVTSCTGTWDCGALTPDGGATPADCQAFSSATGLACR